MLVVFPTKTIAFIEIPKTGTQSVCTGVTTVLGQRHYKGHKPMSYLKQKVNPEVPLEFVATLRNPYERFLSAINYIEDYRSAPIKEHVEKSLTGRGRYGQVFTPVSHWLDLPEEPLTLFTNVGDTLEYLGIPKGFHENKSSHKYSIRDLGPWMDFIEEHYEWDINLWKSVIRHDSRK